MRTSFSTGSVVLALAALGFVPCPARGAPILFIDPTGDTFAPGPDITSYGAARMSTGDVVFTVNFAGPISPPSAFAANSVAGFIDIDADQNPATGAAPQLNRFIPPVPGPAIALGDEFYVLLDSEAFNPGFVDVLNAITNATVATVPVTFTQQGLSLAIPSSLLNDDGRLNFAVLVGTFGGDLSDRAPNGATPAASIDVDVAAIPEPGTLVLLGLGLASLLGYGRHRFPRPLA